MAGGEHLGVSVANRPMSTARSLSADAIHRSQRPEWQNHAGQLAHTTPVPTLSCSRTGSPPSAPRPRQAGGRRPPAVPNVELGQPGPRTCCRGRTATHSPHDSHETLSTRALNIHSGQCSTQSFNKRVHSNMVPLSKETASQELGTCAFCFPIKPIGNPRINKPLASTGQFTFATCKSKELAGTHTYLAVSTKSVINSHRRRTMPGTRLSLLLQHGGASTCRCLSPPVAKF